jgi:endonuclease G, mitochondrial
MKKTFLSLLMLFSLTSIVYAWDQKPNQPISACAAQVPYGAPALNKPNMTVECHTGYALEHDNVAKIPAWVAYTLTPQHAIGCVPRTNAFVADAILGANGSKPSDYAGSGYDQGHLAPDGDMSWDTQVEYESFLMSNMSPQLPNLNRGIWKALESNVRAWAYGNGHSYTIYAGNIYTVGKSKTIGADKVVVPDFLYKIVIDDNTKQVLAFTFPQVASQPIDLPAHLVSIASIEQATGITFPVPPGTDKTKPATAVWPVDLKKTADAKKAACKGAPGTED